MLPQMRRLLGLAPLFLASTAVAAPCAPSTGHSSCIDANTLWLHADRSPFVSVAPASPGENVDMSMGLASGYLSRPITANVPSSDPDGRDVLVLDHVVDGTILGAYTLDPGWTLSFALPFAAYQTGSGVEGISDQDAAPVARSAARDPRIGTSYGLLDGPLRAAAHTTLVLPFGDDEALAGGPSVALEPALSAELLLGDRLRVGAEVGVRLREEVELAGTRYGHQLRGALGVAGVAIPRWLTISAEAWLLPALTSSESESFGGTTRSTTQIPAEWFLSVSSLLQPDFQLLLGGGGGIPLSTEDIDSPTTGSTSERFLGLTTPRFRALLLARFFTDAD